MQRSWAVFFVAVIAFLVSTSAHAEVGTGPPLVLRVPLNAPLGETTDAFYVTDDQSDAFDATVRATVIAAGETLATLGPFDVHATGTPQTLRLTLPTSAAARLKQLAAAHPHGSGAVNFDAVIPTRYATGPYYESVSSPVTIGAPFKPTSATTLPFGHRTFTGSSDEVGGGTVTLPLSWPRTSRSGLPFETFGPVAVGNDCTAYAIAQPVAVATRDVMKFLNHLGGPSVVRRTKTVRVAAGASPATGFPFGRGAVLLKARKNRYAGVRVDLTFMPGCSAADGSAPSVVDAVYKAMRGVKLHLNRPA